MLLIIAREVGKKVGVAIVVTFYGDAVGIQFVVLLLDTCDSL